MPYQVKIKQKGRLFWQSYAQVEGDYLLENGMRVLHLVDKSLILVPMEGTLFRFGPERQELVDQKIEEEAKKNGQKVPPKRAACPLQYRYSRLLPWKKALSRDEPMDLKSHYSLLLKDGSRLELPVEGLELRFGKERFETIKKQMEQEAGQSIQIAS